MIKGRLLSSRPMLKPCSGDKIQSRQNGAQSDGLGGNGGQNLRHWFCDPQKALPCAEPSRLTFLRQNRCARLGCSLSQEPEKVAESLCAEGREITHAQN